MASFFSHSSSNISPLGSSGGGFVGIFMYQSMSALLYLVESATFGSFGVEHFQLSLDVSGELHIPPHTLVPLLLLNFLAECVTGQFRLLILVEPVASHSPQPAGRLHS